MWTANFIWQPENGPENTWMCFRKTVHLQTKAASAVAVISADSKYFLWINGERAVYEGGAKRGPAPGESYYDEVDIAKYLRAGENIIAVLVWYWGISCCSHIDNGKGGLLFQADIDGLTIESDETWKAKTQPAYQKSERPSCDYPGYNVNFDARLDFDSDWTSLQFDDSQWPTAVTKGIPPSEPWGQLRKRPIPDFWHGVLKEFEEIITVPATDRAGCKTVKGIMPYNTHATPFIRVKAASGQRIDIRTDNILHAKWDGATFDNMTAVYTTKEGEQEFESLAWINGHEFWFTMPDSVEILSVMYRESGYGTDFAGGFECSDEFLNSYFKKAIRTLYVCMRDNIMDCPDRERSPWIGDATNQFAAYYYVFDERARMLIAKTYRELAAWRTEDLRLKTLNPGGAGRGLELPAQCLASIGMFGIWDYYMHTADRATLTDVYPAIKDYLSLWGMGENGLPLHRKCVGGGLLGDWADNSESDTVLICAVWYYLALKSAGKVAGLTGNKPDIPFYAERMKSMELNFDKVFWTEAGYRSPGYEGCRDEKGSALAVLAGLADRLKWPTLTELLSSVKTASPCMERYVLEALFVMGEGDLAIGRFKDRYGVMVDKPYTTLFEGWDYEPECGGTYNHAWSSGMVAVLFRYLAGIAPLTPGFGKIRVSPTPVSCVNRLRAWFFSDHGKIDVSWAKENGEISLDVNAPDCLEIIF